MKPTTSKHKNIEAANKNLVAENMELTQIIEIHKFEAKRLSEACNKL